MSREKGFVAMKANGGESRYLMLRLLSVFAHIQGHTNSDSSTSSQKKFMTWAFGYEKAGNGRGGEWKEEKTTEKITRGQEREVRV